MQFFDRIPLWMFALAAIFMGIAPVYPQPHLLEKINMLLAGTLSRPVDIFDLFWHSLFSLLLIVKIIRMGKVGVSDTQGETTAVDNNAKVKKSDQGD